MWDQRGENELYTVVLVEADQPLKEKDYEEWSKEIETCRKREFETWYEILKQYQTPL